MQIKGKMNIQNLKFKDLKRGDTFYFLDKISSDPLTQRIFMKLDCPGLENMGVDLETGICQGFDEDRPARKVDAILKIEKEEQKTFPKEVTF